jgi:FKBP-type peptidyl-prolyl cis-trans isomerase
MVEIPAEHVPPAHLALAATHAFAGVAEGVHTFVGWVVRALQVERVLNLLKPRQPASAAQLADPAQYSAFEEQHNRDQIMAYASGVQQIPAIRERIEQAAQSGERSQTELDEARAALEQLEMLQSKLQRERPELLQGAGIATGKTDAVSVHTP